MLSYWVGYDQIGYLLALGPFDFSTSGVADAAMPIATATTTAFLMIYCPSSVGTRNPCQVYSGTSNSGEHTITIWNNSSGTTIRVILGNRNNIPTMHSITARMINSSSKNCIPTVFAVSASANGLAGLNPNNLINPNQKKTMKIDIRATGTNVRLKNAITRRSTIS